MGEAETRKIRCGARWTVGRRLFKAGGTTDGFRQWGEISGSGLRLNGRSRESEAPLMRRGE